MLVEPFPTTSPPAPLLDDGWQAALPLCGEPSHESVGEGVGDVPLSEGCGFLSEPFSEEQPPEKPTTPKATTRKQSKASDSERDSLFFIFLPLFCCVIGNKGRRGLQHKNAAETDIK
jgi:hypothetical protein